MIVGAFGYWRSMTKRERKLNKARLRERAREREAMHREREAKAEAKRRGSWDRMREQIARKYA